jgi:DNA-binding NarL/FixJ family response regulator
LAYVKSILIADDNASIRRGLRRMFQQEGWNVCAEAIDGREAIAKAREFKPQIVVLDMAMPIMNGLDAGVMLKKMMPETCLILFTSHGKILTEEKAQSFGFSALISKSEGESIVAAAERILVGRSNQIGVA